MTIISQITDDVKNAMKAGNSLRTRVIRLLLAELKNLEISRRAKQGGELTAPDLISTVRRLISQEKETLDFLKKDNRTEQVEESENKIKIFESYLGQELSDEELDSILAQVNSELKPSGMKDFGRVMKEVMERVANRADGARVSGKLKGMLEK